MDNNSGTAPSQIIINDQTYSPEDAQKYIDMGRKTEEMETKWNTKLESVWPEVGRTREQIRTLNDELATYKQKASEGTVTAAETADAKATAQQLGVKFEDLDKAGYIKQEKLDAYLEERDAKKSQADQATKAVLDQADKLSTEINGEDGRPKFSKRLVIAYASAYGKPSLEEAYNEMYEDELKVWKDNQIEKQRRSSLKTQGAAGSKEPKAPRINKDNFREALSESLNTSE